jgi:hypothetical protein
MQKISEELREFFLEPTARCFKGFSILLMIWGCASLLICALVPTIIKVHNPLPNSKYTDFGGDNGNGNNGGAIDPLTTSFAGLM